MNEMRMKLRSHGGSGPKSRVLFAEVTFTPRRFGIETAVRLDGELHVYNVSTVAAGVGLAITAVSAAGGSVLHEAALSAGDRSSRFSVSALCRPGTRELLATELERLADGRPVPAA